MYEISKILSGLLWKKISNIFGLVISINISLIGIIPLNFMFCLTESVFYLAILRLLTGIFNPFHLLSKVKYIFYNTLDIYL
jgi:hypothetical protein